jgi:O-antigen/teichoic acid export membrane protein
MKVLTIERANRYAGRLRKDAIQAYRGRSKVLKNFSALFTADVLSKLLTLLAVGYLARTLDSDAFGRIAFAESLLLGALVAADFGLEWYGVREIARSSATVRDNVATVSSLRLVLFACALTVFALLPVVLRTPVDVRIMIWLFGLSLIPNALLFEWVFCGLERMEIVALGRLLRSGLYSLMILTFVQGNQTVLAAPISYFIATAIGAAVLLVIYIRDFGLPRVEWQLRRWRGVLAGSAPFAFNVLMLRGYYSMSMIVLAMYVSDSAVGIFSAAYRPVLVLVPLGGYLMTAVFPPLARAGDAESREFQRLSRRLVTVVVMCAAPILVGSLMHPQSVMQVLFGSQYTSGGDAFRVLAVSLPVMWMSMVYGTLLMATDRAARFVAGVVAGLATSGLLCIVLVPIHGIEGAVWSILGGQLTCLLFFWSSLPAGVRSIPWVELLIALVASAVMAWVVLLLQSSVLRLQMVVGCLAYSMVSLAGLAVRPGANLGWRSRMDTAVE